MGFGRAPLFFLLIFASFFGAGSRLITPSLADPDEWSRMAQASSVEEFVENLPEAYRAMMALMYSSRSAPKDASFTQPRVLLNDATGTKFVAFWASPEGRKSQIVEIVDRSTSPPTFIEIDFSKPASDRLAVGKKECMGCHSITADQRRGSLLWDGSNDVRGSFGTTGELEPASDRELFRKLAEQPPDRLRKLFPDGMPAYETLVPMREQITHRMNGGYLEDLAEALVVTPGFSKRWTEFLILSDPDLTHAMLESSLTPKIWRDRLSDLTRDAKWSEDLAIANDAHRLQLYRSQDLKKPAVELATASFQELAPDTRTLVRIAQHHGLELAVGPSFPRRYGTVGGSSVPFREHLIRATEHSLAEWTRLTGPEKDALMDLLESFREYRAWSRKTIGRYPSGFPGLRMERLLESAERTIREGYGWEKNPIAASTRQLELRMQTECNAFLSK